jgi:hypothetical protein
MDTSDAQASLGSDGLIESHPHPTPVIESTTVQSPTSSKITVNILLFCYTKMFSGKFSSHLRRKLYMH